MITPKKIDHVCLQVTDLNRSKKYYETLFGVKCWLREDNSKMLVVETKGVHFFLAESKAGHEFLSNQHLSLQVDNLNEVICILENLKITDYETGIIDFFEHENYRWCEWRDPDNIRLECVEPITNLST